MEQRARRRTWAIRSALGALAVIIALIFLVGALPVGWLRGIAEQRLSSSIGSKVSVGSVTRTPWFSFTPLISVRDVSIDQPAWAGPGKLVTVRAVEAKVSTWSLLTGDLDPRSLRIEGLQADLVRLEDKRNNWSDNKKDGRSNGGVPALADLVIENSRFKLREQRRNLILDGTISANAGNGLRIVARGKFHEAPVTVEARGGRIAGIDPAAAYPFALTMRSSLLLLDARLQLAGTLNVKRFAGRISARGQDLEYLDDIIEAGLFHTQPIALAADVRRDLPDWHVERLRGTIGRSELTGAVTVKKRDGRSKIDGAIRFSQLDFKDLSSDEGLQRAAALRARIGPRVIPRTRINLARIGPTDGVLRVRADRLIIPRGSVFKTLSGTLNLDHRTLTVTDLVAGMERGRLFGTVRVKQEAGPPLLTVDARVEGTSLEQLFGGGKDVSGPVRGRILLAGRGDTIRDALGRADGRVALVVRDGSVKATVAHVLGQDLGRTIGQALDDGGARVPLRCVIARFDARNGVLSPNPLAVETGVSVGRGSGSIVLDGERVALTISGAAKRKVGLRIEDPLRVGGTLSSPAISVAGVVAAKQPTTGTVLKVIGRSLGGLFDGRKSRAAIAPQSIDCAALAASALR